MLSKIKLSMRISHSNLDSDIQKDIDACLKDLRRVGIVNIDEEGALIIKLCELYCKWQYDFGGRGDQYRNSYESLRDALSLSEDYNTEAVV